MKIDEMIAVLQAAKAGKTIQYQSLGIAGPEWYDCALNSPCWDFSRHWYRAKPEPREWNVRVVNGQLQTTGHTLTHLPYLEESIRVREVL